MTAARPVDEGLLWWRVETDKDGDIKSCAEVEYASAPGRLVRFVQANTNAEACDKVKRWYRARAEESRRQRAQQRANLHASKLCERCRKPLDRDGVSCQACLVLKKLADAALRDRRSQGDTVDRRYKHATLEASFAAYKATAHERSVHWRRARCGVAWATLVEKLDRLGPEEFRAWLVSKIPAMRQDTAEHPMAEAAE